MATYIFNKVSYIDWLEQTRLFYEQKYKDFTLEYEWRITRITDILNNIDDFSVLEKLLVQKYSSEMTFNIYWKQLTFNQLQELEGPKSKTKIWEVGKAIIEKVKFVLADFRNYKMLLQTLKNKKLDKENISWEEYSLDAITDFYRRATLSEIIKSERMKKSEQTDFEIPFDDNFYELLWIDKEGRQKVSPKEIQDIAWKYKFFKTVQKSVEKWYIYTKSELDMIIEITEDLKDWKVVLLTGDTGSGKTEVAKFICKEFLKTKFVFISWSVDSEVWDFTVERAVNSRGVNDTEEHVVTWESKDEEKRALEFFNKLMGNRSFKQVVIDRAPDDQKDELRIELEAIDFDKKHLITEYHLMALYKAATLWLPLIIDESNLIRTQVLLALNDLLMKKKWDPIQLPNGLHDIVVEEGYCAILTWNDPEQNKKAWKYTTWRSNYDEAFYNRLRVYAKDYFRQEAWEKKEQRLEELDKTLEYLNDNEMYWVILMMMFSWKNSKTTTWKYGYEIMKRTSDGWWFLTKEWFFDEMKRYATLISEVQKAYSGEVITSNVNSTFSIKEAIKRKVFSMRNLLEVFGKYKNDNKALEYHLYKEFISHTTSKDELYALLLLANKNGFFQDIITDGKEKSISSVEKLIWSYPSEYTVADIENKVIITKQDLYKEYFWSFEVSDAFFEWAKKEINLQEASEDNGASIEITIENLVDAIDWCKGLLDEKQIYFDIPTYLHISTVLKILQVELEWEPERFNDKLKAIYKVLNDLSNSLDELNDDNSDNEVVLNLVWNLSNSL